MTAMNEKKDALLECRSATFVGAYVPHSDEECRGRAASAALVGDFQRGLWTRASALKAPARRTSWTRCATWAVRAADADAGLAAGAAATRDPGEADPAAIARREAR